MTEQQQETNSGVWYLFLIPLFALIFGMAWIESIPVSSWPTAEEREQERKLNEHVRRTAAERDRMINYLETGDPSGLDYRTRRNLRELDNHFRTQRAVKATADRFGVSLDEPKPEPAPITSQWSSEATKRAKRAKEEAERLREQARETAAALDRINTDEARNISNALKLVDSIEAEAKNQAEIAESKRRISEYKAELEKVRWEARQRERERKLREGARTNPFVTE